MFQKISNNGEADTIDMSELLDLLIGLIAPDSGISGSQMNLNISNVLGKNEKFILAAAYDIHFNKDGVELGRKTISSSAKPE